MMLHDGQSIRIPNELDSEKKPTQAFLDNLLVSGTDPTGGGSATDRSSASPSNADDLMEDDVNHSHKESLEEDDDDEEEEEEEVLETNNNRDYRTNISHRMNGMETQFMYLQHQLSRIMRQLHVTPCACESCSIVHQTINGVRQLNDPTQMLSQLFPNASSQQLETLLELSKMNKLPSQVVSQKDHNHHSPIQTTSTQNLPQITPAQITVQPIAITQNPAQIMNSNSSPTPISNASLVSNHNQPRLSSRSPPATSVMTMSKLGTGYPTNPSCGGGKIAVERGASESRKAIVEFAKNHGGAAAAKKFGFPPPVATYYQKKESSHSLVPTTPLATVPQIQPANYSTSSATSIQPPNSATASPGPSSDGGDRDENPDTPHYTESSTNSMCGGQSTPATPSIANPPIFTQSMVDMLKMNANAAHSTGSPGFLRGRGRGRPKLIGDELDADLVDYMVQVKQTDPHGHLTASQALHIAKQYILERAPGLLEEHGGHVKLKLTWAMKLVSRIAERQKEIEYGLPAGTLSNMGRNLGSLPGGNFMADVMAQNIFSQHMMMVNQAATGYGDAKTANQEMTTGLGVTKKSEVISKKDSLHNNEENVVNGASISDIVNIKELNIPFLNNFLAELNEKNAGLAVDGEIANQRSIQDAEMRNV